MVWVLDFLFCFRSSVSISTSSLNIDIIPRIALSLEPRHLQPLFQRSLPRALLRFAKRYAFHISVARSVRPRTLDSLRGFGCARYVRSISGRCSASPSFTPAAPKSKPGRIHAFARAASNPKSGYFGRAFSMSAPTGEFGCSVSGRAKYSTTV
jgi:hypothetical protein